MPGSARFTQVRLRTLRQQVLEPLRNAILCGQLPVGQRLLEAEIAAQMGVSRVPVREALRQLEHEGLVVSQAHRGTLVAAVDEDEVDLLYHLRAELEGFALSAAISRADHARELLERLRELLEAMRVGAREGNLPELAERDLEFHQAIMASSGYRTLAAVWRSMDGPIRARLQRCLAGPFRQNLILYTAESHQPVVEAIASCDSARAVAALKQHILETRTLVETGVRSNAEEDSRDAGLSSRAEQAPV